MVVVIGGKIQHHCIGTIMDHCSSSSLNPKPYALKGDAPTLGTPAPRLARTEEPRTKGSNAEI